VQFGPVTPELAKLICERHAKKLAYCVEYHRIYWTDFRNLYHMKALYMQMMDLYLIFQFVKVRCHGNQIVLP